MGISKNSRAEILMHVVVKGVHPGVETTDIPDEPDNPTRVMWWKALGQVGWRRVVGCVGLQGGFSKERRCFCRGLAKMNNSLTHRAFGRYCQ